MKTATIFTHTVSIRCPHCEDWVINPNNHGMDWPASEVKDRMTCSECGGAFRTGKAIALF